MPTYGYRVKEGHIGCPHCRDGFECFRQITAPPLTHCPQCGSPVEKMISAPYVATSQGKLDDRARQAGFHKFQRIGRGEYEKAY